MALNSRIDEIIGLFCKRALYKRRYSAKETYNFMDPTDRSHPIGATTGAEMQYRVIPASRNCQVETADWNLDVRLDI